MNLVDAGSGTCGWAEVHLCFRLWWRKETRKAATWRSAPDASWATSLLIYWKRSLWLKTKKSVQMKSLKHTLNIAQIRIKRLHRLGQPLDFLNIFITITKVETGHYWDIMTNYLNNAYLNQLVKKFLLWSEQQHNTNSQVLSEYSAHTDSSMWEWMLKSSEKAHVNSFLAMKVNICWILIWKLKVGSVYF